MFNHLYEKYKVPSYRDLPSISPLSFIIRKTELAHNLTDEEWNWLEQHQLFETKKIIKNQEDYRVSLYKEIHQEIIKLRTRKFIPFSIIKENDTTESVIDSKRAFILYQVDAEQRLTKKELSFINSDYHHFLDTKDFNESKKRYGITKDVPFNTTTKNFIKKLNNNTLFCSKDIKWLYENNTNCFLKSLEKQFSDLQYKYKVPTRKEINKPLLLFYILQNLEENEFPSTDEMEYLKKQVSIETLNIFQKMKFLALKRKYKAEQSQEENINNHLFKVLKKLEINVPLPEQDINYLKKRKLFETLKFNYKKHADSLHHKVKQGYALRTDDVLWCEEHNFEEIIFEWLKLDYDIQDSKYTFESLLYVILKKLETGKKLTDDEVIWLETENLLRVHSKIYTTHHAVEALFYEHEFQRTKDYWKLVNASAHWRKAEIPTQALKQTDKLNFKKIKSAKLKAALLTSRGGALRDIKSFDEAEECALQAIKYLSNSHNPYTLMGALCYDTNRYDEGSKWFKEAEKHGAKQKNQDIEIKNIFHKKKEKERQQLAKHLLKKDSRRFTWVKQYIKKVNN